MLPEPKNAENTLSSEELYDKYAPAVYGKILSIVKHEPIANKVLEKVFLNALKHKNIPANRFHTPLVSLLNHSQDKTKKTLKALHILSECCGVTTTPTVDKEY